MEVTEIHASFPSREIEAYGFVRAPTGKDGAWVMNVTAPSTDAIVNIAVTIIFKMVVFISSAIKVGTSVA